MQRTLADWIAGWPLLALCAAYLQGGFNKRSTFDGRQFGEMRHFGLAPAGPLALALPSSSRSVLPLLVVCGVLALGSGAHPAGFTLFATLVANRFWEMVQPERFMAANSFFEHIGLIGASSSWPGTTCKPRDGARQ